QIIKNKVPGIDEVLAGEITRFMQELRNSRLEKTPGIAETIDWAMALTALHIDHLDKKIIEQTLGVLLKDWRDTRQVQMSLSELMEKTGIHSRVTEHD
ncbi:MAG TPA: MoxR family ATPase, partial [Chitinophagaceae bacterium]|nr:MoxR family ATPase [Chitinophagaceae bacterium]